MKLTNKPRARDRRLKPVLSVQWRATYPSRPERVRRRRNGRLEIVKRPDAAHNGKARAVTVRYAGGDTVRLGKIDLRFTMGRVYRERIAELTSHLGGDLTAPEAVLVDQAARFHLLTRLAWDAVSTYGAYKDGAPTPGNDAYRRAAADERTVLLTLGLERKAREVQDLKDYIESKAKRLTYKRRSEDAVDAEEV